MRTAIHRLLSLHLLASCLSAADATITLDNGFTWKAMFDAGFRPSHVRDGTDKCRQLNVHVKLRKEEGGEALDLGVGDVEFSLRDGHLLDLFSFYGREYRPVDSIQEKSEVFSRAFGDAVKQKARVDWFDVEHSEDYSGRKIEPPVVTRVLDDRNATNGAKIGDLSIVYSFRSANSRDKPIVERLSIALRSPEAMQGRPVKTKIQPPVGYQHISLEPVAALPAQSSEAATKEPHSATEPDSTSGGSLYSQLPTNGGFHLEQFPPAW